MRRARTVRALCGVLFAALCCGAIVVVPAVAKPIDQLFAGKAAHPLVVHDSKSQSAHTRKPKHHASGGGHGTLVTAPAGSVLFGERTIASNEGANRAGLAQAFALRSHRAGTVSSISVYVGSSDQASTLLAGLYSNHAGHPDSLLTSGSLWAPKAGAWNLVDVRSTRIQSGHTYWLAVLGMGGKLAFRATSPGSCTSENSRQSSLTSLPHAWTAGSQRSVCPLSAYGSGTPAKTTATTLTHSPIATTPSAGSTAGTATGTAGSAGSSTTSVQTLLPTLPPVNDGAPTVSGTPQAGQTLSTTNGSWLDSPTSYSYQWQDCDSLGVTCTNIAGATGSTYTLTSSDVGDTVRSVVTATNAGGSASANSAPTATVTTPPAPSNSAVPVVSGAVQQGQTLSTTNGSWTNDPTSYSYQWEDCNSSGASCSNISGATSGTYKLASGDVRHTVRSVVKATNAGGSASADSAATAVVTPLAPANSALPVVSGTAEQGDALSTTNGSWSNSPTGYSYAWEDCNSSGASCTTIGGATGSSYTLVSGDVGHTIRSVVTASNAGGSASASSAATAVVAASTPPAPSNTAVPVVSGTAQQGDTLSTTNGSWSNSPTSYAYAWQDCNSSGASCSNISGATSSTYTLASNDVGDTVRSVVTASNAGGSGSASSAVTGVVTASSGGGGGLPSGVTLTAIDGGSNYYCSSGFTYACNDGWDSPSFFPIGHWYGGITSASDVSIWQDLGWNTTYRTTGSDSPSVYDAACASNGTKCTGSWPIYVIEGGWGGDCGSCTTGEPETSGFSSSDPAVVGLMTYDEPPNFQDGVINPLSETPNAWQDHRFWWGNYTYYWVGNGGSSPISSSAQVLASEVTTPDGTVRHPDLQSLDEYWFASVAGKGSGDMNVVYGGIQCSLYNTCNTTYTNAQAACGCRYGDLIDMERAYQTPPLAAGNTCNESGNPPCATPAPAPIVSLIETGGPDSGDNTAAQYIQPPEV